MNVCVLGTNLLSAPDRFDKRIDRNGGGIVAYKINLEGQCLKDSVIFKCITEPSELLISFLVVCGLFHGTLSVTSASRFIDSSTYT